jgi:hypothetical protein
VTNSLAYSRSYYVAHRKTILKKHRQWNARHHDTILKSQRARYVNNHAVELANRRKYRLSHPKMINLQARVWRSAHLEVTVMHNAVADMLRRAGIHKSARSRVYVGCTPAFLRLHLEAQFKRGMSWVNYGVLWEVDHRIPVSWFNLRECPDNMFIASHWRNLQPMFKKTNRSKQARYVA